MTTPGYPILWEWGTLFRYFRCATGLFGVVVEARAGGLLPAVGPVLDRLMADPFQQGDVFPAACAKLRP